MSAFGFPPPNDPGLQPPAAFLRVTAGSPSAPPLYYDVVNPQAPNLAIGSAFPNIQTPAAFSNTALGGGVIDPTPHTGSLGQLTTGHDNMALGNNVLSNLTTGSGNTSVGADSLSQAQTGSFNSAFGAQALENLNAAISNCSAFGTGALQNSTNGPNDAFGSAALVANTTGIANVAVGYASLTANTTGNLNTGIGYQSLTALTTGHDHVAIGYQANAAITTTKNSVAIGSGTVAGGNGSVAIGKDSSDTSASTAVNNVIALGTALHQLQLKNNATGAGSAALGANCPATTVTAPYTWLKLMSNDGSTVYVPAWK